MRKKGLPCRLPPPFEGGTEGAKQHTDEDEKEYCCKAVARSSSYRA